MIEVGSKGSYRRVVEEQDTARVHGSGTLRVLATPAMAAWMEHTAMESVQPQLGEGEGTVGTLLELRHLAPTPVGMAVTCESTLVEAQGRRLVFEVEAFDETGKIGEAKHERFIIRSEAFQAKADSKRK